jgi:ubiquitin-conjugating enzyme E2 G2
MLFFSLKTGWMAARRLLKEYKQLVEDAPEGIHAGPMHEDDFLHWECLLDGPENSLYEGGIFRAVLDFPQDYPMKPPTMTFSSEIFHPNIGKDGKVCISILHSGDDPSNYEQRNERWSAAQSVEKILLSVMSMLAEPNPDSPANVDAAKMWRDDRIMFKQRVVDNVRKSLGL